MAIELEHGAASAERETAGTGSTTLSIVGGRLTMIELVLLFASFCMRLWNRFMPSLFGLPAFGSRDVLEFRLLLALADRLRGGRRAALRRSERNRRTTALGLPLGGPLYYYPKNEWRPETSQLSEGAYLPGLN